MQLLYFSPVPYASYWQRPHFFVEAARTFGAEKILWVEPYARRLPHWSDLKRARELVQPPMEESPNKNMANGEMPNNITVLRVPALPIEPLPGGTGLNSMLLWRGVWKELDRFADGGSTILAVGGPSRLALAALSRLPTAARLYDAMDDFPEFYRGISRAAFEWTEQQIIAHVDLVTVSASCLAAKFTGQSVPVELVPNACGIREFPLTSADRPPRKVLGYIGSIAAWFDWPLVIRLAESVPDTDVELIGPCFTPPPGSLPPTIKMYGGCDHHSLHKHLNRFAAGLIPFRINRLTASVDPIKYYDYRCFGLPVISTSFGEMANRQSSDSVFFLDRVPGSAADLKAIVGDSLSQSIPQSVTESFRRANCWEARFASATKLRALLTSSAAHTASPASGTPR